MNFGGPENHAKTFQQQEFEGDIGVNIYEFRYRFNAYEIGRFWQIDPLATKYVYNSVYSFSENHVTSHVELEGREKLSIHDPNFITFGPLNRPAYVDKKTIAAGTYRFDSRPNVIKSGFSLSKPKVTGVLRVGAVAAIEVKGVGVSGGKGVDFVGVKDNEFHVGGKNLSTGKMELTTSAEGAALGCGTEWEKVEEKNSNGDYEKKSETTTTRTGFVFTATEEKDAKSGETSKTYSLSLGFSIGIGLVLRAEINIPFYHETIKY